MLIVRDTRESGEMLEAALAAGVAAGGGHALLGGVLPTPGASLLVRRYGFDLAAVVSASHNPYQDNGIKFFGPEGTKLDDDQEAEIEGLLGEPRPASRHRPGARAPRRRRPTTCASSRPASPTCDLDGVRVLLDCANGATHRVAPEIFRAARRRRRRDRRSSPTAATSTATAAPPTSSALAGQLGRPRPRLRLRRRRRPRARGRPQRRGRRRRRAAGARRAPPARARTGCRATAWP